MSNGPVVSSDSAASPTTLAERDSVGDLYAVQLRGSGGVRSAGCNYHASVAKTAVVTVDDTMEVIECDATGGSFAVNLPAAATCTGKRVTVKKTNAANTVTITANGAELIDAANTLAITTQYQSRTIQSNGTKWLIISGYL